ncbi:hypothetical protein [Amaricoccus sp.]|uniref:hypothetical protein n=1 Tax=Amaricoccus sp. TaxID=1872485 RepID=UPI001B4C35CD|nr:hypothetical protein [Amaricoccus sp.]MBP7241187.1 hypothetical protein [Amaricoccus sp.]
MKSPSKSTLKKSIVLHLQDASDRRLTRSSLWQKIDGLNGKPTPAYWDAEQHLVDQGKIERRQGRNGGIYLIEEPARSDADLVDVAAEAARDEFSGELDHYDPIISQIEAHWNDQLGYTKVFCAKTALQGRRTTGGKWSRPDIILCTISDWIFSSRHEGEVRTIEVKRFETLDVLAVYEALSHKSRSHYAYLMIVNFPSALNSDEKSLFDNVLAVAGKNGIGVITAVDSSNWSTWSFELSPAKSDADNQSIHQLLMDQFPAERRDQFRTALREFRVVT